MTSAIAPYCSVDVYKRQLEGISIVIDPGHGGYDPGSLGVAYGYGPTEDEINMAYAVAVSYTHLDVYKRQQVGIDLVLQITRQEAELLARFHGGTGENDAVDPVSYTHRPLPAPPGHRAVPGTLPATAFPHHCAGRRNSVRFPPNPPDSGPDTGTAQNESSKAARFRTEAVPGAFSLLSHRR